MDKINLIKFQKINIIKNNKGNLYKILNNKKKLDNINEIYCSTIKPKKIKAWRLHKKITNKFVLLRGKVILIAHKNNKYQKILISKKKFGFFIIKPNTWYGFKCISNEESLILNLINKKFKENEILREEKSKFNFIW